MWTLLFCSDLFGHLSITSSSHEKRYQTLSAFPCCKRQKAGWGLGMMLCVKDITNLSHLLPLPPPPTTLMYGRTIVGHLVMLHEVGVAYLQNSDVLLPPNLHQGLGDSTAYVFLSVTCSIHKGFYHSFGSKISPNFDGINLQCWGVASLNDLIRCNWLIFSTMNPTLMGQKENVIWSLNTGFWGQIL